MKGKKCAVSSSEPESMDGEDEQHTKHSSKSNHRQSKRAQLDMSDAEVVEVGISEEEAVELDVDRDNKGSDVWMSDPFDKT